MLDPVVNVNAKNAEGAPAGASQDQSFYNNFQAQKNDPFHDFLLWGNILKGVIFLSPEVIIEWLILASSGRGSFSIFSIYIDNWI